MSTRAPDAGVGDVARQPAPRSQPPLVSVLVSAYNHERFIEECLDSIRDEGYPRMEVVVVDDGSTDGTLARARAWRESNPRAFERFVLETQRNRGVATVLNRMASLARSEWLVLVSGDDYLLTGGITARLEALRRRPDWLWVFSDSIVIDDEGQPTHGSALVDLYHADKAALRDDRTRRLELILRWSPAGSAVLLRKAALDPATGVGPWDELTLIDDREMYLRLMAADVLGFVDQTVAAYRRHPGSAVRMLRVELLRSVAQVERRHGRSFRGPLRAAMWLQAARSAAVLAWATRRPPLRSLARLALAALNRIALLVLVLNARRAGRRPLAGVRSQDAGTAAVPSLP